MTFSFSGPSLEGIIPSLAGAVVVGSLYSTLTQTSYLSVVILMIKEIASYTFYHIRMSSNEIYSDKQKARIYAKIELALNILTLLALRRFYLIGQKGTFVLTALIIIEMTCKIVDFPKYYH